MKCQQCSEMFGVPAATLDTEMSSSLVLFTTETFVRELDWQLVAASRLAEQGRTCIIGKLAALTTVARVARAGGVVVGRVFEPAFPGVDLVNLALFHSRGFSLVHLDEEGAVFQGDEERWRRVLSRRVDLSVLSPTDCVATWGGFQARHYGEHATNRANVIVTGHPRFDLYLPQYEGVWRDAVVRIQKRVGTPYILINSNVSLANHGQGLAYAFSKRAGFDLSDPQRRRDHLDYWVYANRVLCGLVKLAHRISVERPDMQVVVRPHPSESIAFYRTILGQLPNVHITRDEPVGAWLANATAVVQHGCTTALEAAIGGVPVINYRVAVDARYDKALPDAVGVPCDTEDDVLAALGAGESARPPIEPWAMDLLANLAAPSLPLFTELVASRTSPAPCELRVRELKTLRAAELAKDAVRRQLSRVSPRRRTMRAYSQSKFPGFTRSLLREKRRVLERVLGYEPNLEMLDRELLLLNPRSS